MKKYLLLLLTVFFLNSELSANEIICKKFDIKCKTKKYIEDTKNYQKKGLKETKDQISKGTGIIKDKTDIIKDKLPKK